MRRQTILKRDIIVKETAFVNGLFTLMLFLYVSLILTSDADDQYDCNDCYYDDRKPDKAAYPQEGRADMA